jgi:multiple sugar transport system substrate-binding protein
LCATVQELLKPFYATHPNIKVDCVLVPWGEVETKWKTAIQSGETPDLGYIWDVALPTYIRMGGLEPLDSYLDSAFLSKYNPGIVDTGRGEDGKLYALVPLITTDVLFYNKTMFEKAGIPFPDPLYSPSWEEYLGWLQKLKAAGFYGWDWGIRSDLIDHVHWDGYRRFGASDISADHKSVTFDTPEALAWAKAMQDLAQTYKVLPPKALTVDWVRSEAFLQGQAATLEYWTGLPAVLKDYPDIKWGVCKAWHGPGDGGKASAAYLGIGYHVVFKASKHKAEAIELLKFMDGPEFLPGFNRAIGTFPPIKGGDQTYAASDAETKAVADLTWNILTTDAKFFYPWKGVFRWSSESFLPNLQALLLGKMTPEDFCRKVTDDGNRILKEEAAN